MKLPNFGYEKRIWKKGYRIVAGVDEVGRGCFAGPIVAAAVAFAPMANAKLQITNGKHLEFRIDNSELIHIDDSKKLTPRQRERAEGWIKENALAWGIGEAGVSIINRVGMAKATKMAFRKAIAQTNYRLWPTAYGLRQEKRAVVGRRLAIDYLLIDAFFIPYVPNLPTKRKKDKRGRFRKNPKGRQQAIVDGDQKSVSIAAASIIAKVYRDRLMQKISKTPKFQVYGWERNKGYGTAEHQEAIKKYGITRYHRKKFVATFVARSTQT